jgi:hypothetical protein
VAGQIHDGQPVAGIMTFMTMRIDAEIPPRHRRLVWDRLTRWAEIVKNNYALITAMKHNDASPAAVSLSPKACDSCGSIDTAEGICQWCHSGAQKG